MAFPSSRWGVLAALGGTILIWAYGWVLMKQVLAYAGPLDFVALRHLLGAFVLFAALLLSGQSLRPPPLVPTAVIGLFQTAGFQGLEQWALMNGGTGHVALLAYTMPFWAVLLAWWLLGDRPTAHHWTGLALAAAGLLCFIEPWHLESLSNTGIAIAGGIAWAAGTVLSKRMFERDAPALLNFTAWQMLIGSVVLSTVTLAVPQRSIEWNPVFVGALVYNAVLASGLAWWLWTIVLQRLSTTIASVSSLGVPIFSVLLAWLILDEQPSAMEAVGIALILMGILAINGLGKRASLPESPSAAIASTTGGGSECSRPPNVVEREKS